MAPLHSRGAKMCENLFFYVDGNDIRGYMLLTTISDEMERRYMLQNVDHDTTNLGDCNKHIFTTGAIKTHTHFTIYSQTYRNSKR